MSLTTILGPALPVSAQVRFYVTVHRRTSAWMGDSGDLWHRDIHTAFLPDVGDDVMPWADPDDASNGPLWPVKTRYMRPGGSWCVELVGIQVDPPELILRELREEFVARGVASRRPWFSEQWLGSPEECLTTGGWVPGP